MGELLSIYRGTLYDLNLPFQQEDKIIELFGALCAHHIIDDAMKEVKAMILNNVPKYNRKLRCHLAIFRYLLLVLYTCKDASFFHFE